MCRAASENQFNFLVYFDACGFESMLSLIFKIVIRQLQAFSFERLITV